MKSKTTKFLDAWAPLLAFIFIAFVGGYAIQQSASRDAELLRQGLLQSCERANLRDEIANQRSEIMTQVLVAAAESREEEAEFAPTEESKKANLEVADRYRTLAMSVPYVEPVDCENVVPNP